MSLWLQSQYFIRVKGEEIIHFDSFMRGRISAVYRRDNIFFTEFRAQSARLTTCHKTGQIQMAIYCISPSIATDKHVHCKFKSPFGEHKRPLEI